MSDVELVMEYMALYHNRKDVTPALAKEHLVARIEKLSRYASTEGPKQEKYKADLGYCKTVLKAMGGDK